MLRALTTCLAASLVLAGQLLGHPALAQTKVRVGEPQAGTFQFLPLRVGVTTGIFKKHRVVLEITSFGGGPRVQQALTAGAIDLAVGSGPELAFIAKGVPEIGVAALADAPDPVLLAVLKDSPIRTEQDLKGKTISVSSKGSLTYWLAQELSRQLGWGDNGIKLAPLGKTTAQLAALKTRQIDGMIVEANAGYRLEEDGTGRILLKFGDRIKTFHIYVLYASRAFAQKNPDAVRNFLAGWFETVDHMRNHKKETVAIAEHATSVSPAIANRAYDELMGMFNRTGRFDPKALAVLSRSFVQTGQLPEEPVMSKLIDEQFLPKAQ
jgi:ABC-type nitrate/sulfonate/bicarbonate transport system substrate-binding protein